MDKVPATLTIAGIYTIKRQIVGENRQNDKDGRLTPENRMEKAENNTAVNDLNLPFYINVGLKNLQEIAIRGGLQNFIDVKIAFDYIKNSKSILELGAGYGRCLEYLIKAGFEGDMYAVEYVPEFIEYLKGKYGNRVSIIEGDIKSDLFRLEKKVDAALWLWSGFSDFSREEQSLALSKIYSILNDHGKLVIDIPKLENNLSVGQLIDNTSATVAFEKNKVATVEGKDVMWETPYGVFRGYIQSRESMEKLAKSVGFKNVITNIYKTESDIERAMYVLEK